MSSSDPSSDPQDNPSSLPTVAPLGFSSTPSNPDPITAPSSTGEAAGSGSGDGHDWTASSDEPHESSEMPSGSFPASSGARTSRRGQSKQQIAEAIGVLLEAAGQGANHFLTDEAGKEVGLYLVDDQDRAGISDPAANVLYRSNAMVHAPAQITDFVQLGIAAAAYVGKQLSKMRNARQLRRSAAMFPVGDLDDTAAHD